MTLTVSDATRAEYVQLMLDIGTDHLRGPDPVHAAGTAGECWTNAQAFCRAGGSRYRYVEGVVRPSADAPWEMHGYVLDLAAGHVVETTAGYGHAVAYRGLPLDIPTIDECHRRLAAAAEDPDDRDNRCSMVWELIWDAIEETGPPYRLRRSFRLPRGLVVR